MIKFIQRILVLYSLLAGFQAHGQTCTLSNLTTSTIPAQVYTSNQTVAGSLLWAGLVAVQFDCTSNAAGQSIAFKANASFAGSTLSGGDGARITLTHSSTSNPRGGSGSAISVTSGSCTSGVTLDRAWITFASSGQNCKGVAQGSMAFFTNVAGAFSYTVPSALITNSAMGTGWFGAVRCSSVNCAVGSVVPLILAPGPVLNIVARVATCSLKSSSSFTVTLPAVSAGSLSSGKSAGIFPFTVQYNCDTAQQGNISLNTSWMFATSNLVYGTILANTGTATNVGIEILDQTVSPVSPSTPVSLGTISSSGVYVFNWFARYRGNGSPVTAGTVRSTAEFSTTYN